MKPNLSTDPEQAAADWLARRDLGLTPAEEKAFADWLAADARHEAAWLEAKTVWLALDTTRSQGLADGMIRELEARQHRRRWKVQLGWAGGLAAAAAVAVLFFVQSPSRSTTEPLPEASQAVLSRPERRVLEDGSVVELNRGAEIAVNYTAARRDVRLVHGEALFTVTKNPARPFVVTGGNVEVRAVGTAFAVQLGDDAVDVLVTEGRVAVDRPASAVSPETAAATTPTASPVFVSAGGRLIVPNAVNPDEELNVETLSIDEIAHRLAWRGLRLEFSDTRLEELVAVLNRESKVHITIADPALAKMRLSGIFHAENAEGFVSLLTKFDVVVERRPDAIVLRSR